MTSLVLMYVFFDANGDIKAITPSLDEALSKDFTSATFALFEVEAFLTGKQNPFDYTVKSTQKVGGVKYSIAKKFSDIVYTRTLDNYLTKISSTRSVDTILNIVNNTREKVITLSLDSNFRDMLSNGSEDEQDDASAFLNSGNSLIYITDKNNPYVLRYTINYSPKVLFNQTKQYFEYACDLEDSSAYTKKIIGKYCYKERE